MTSCGAFGVYSPASLTATLQSADNNGSGSFRPRFAALRRIPRHAIGVKKYFCGTGPVSKTSDNEDTLATLGDAEVLSVQHSPCHAIPEFIQGLDDGKEVSSAIDREKTRYVFADEPSRESFSQQTFG